MSRTSADEGRYRQQPETINEYLTVVPDPDPLGLAHLEGDELRRELVRCSLLALEPAPTLQSVVAAWGTAAAPTPPSGPEPLSRGRAAGCHSKAASA